MALSLAAAHGEPVRVTNVRANRDTPGLKPQHKACVDALAEIFDGATEGADLGSETVVLRPGEARTGNHHVDVGTAGSVTMLAQALLPACAAAGGRFALRLEGGTDVRWSPPWDYLARVHAPLLSRTGVDVRARLKKRGYYPEGGGRVRVEVARGPPEPASWVDRGDPLEVLVQVNSSNLPDHVGRRIAASAREVLEDALEAPVASAVDDDHAGPSTGCGVVCVLRTDGSVLGRGALGEKGTPSEDVGRTAARRLLEEVEAGAAVDVHQADQIVPYVALAGGGAFTVRELSSHAETALDLAADWFGAEPAVTGRDGHVLVEWH
jgi:RNA 3'-phosphate cyclase